MPMVVLRMEESDARGVGQDDVACLIEHFLSRMRALRVRHALDDARCDLTAATHLQGAVTDVDVSGGEAKLLELMLVLHLKVGDLLDDVRIAGRPAGGYHRHVYTQRSDRDDAAQV